MFNTETQQSTADHISFTVKYLIKMKIQWSSASAVYRIQASLWFGYTGDIVK